MHYNTLNSIQRFWSKVNKTKSCWLWTGKVNYAGYGNTSIRPDNGPPIRLAHRISAYLDGRDPRGHFVCHTCDNPGCVNPAHLVVADAAFNARDRMSKGRNGFTNGTSNSKNKLTEQDVLAIRKDTRKIKYIAQDYGVTPQNVRSIINRKTWRHI